MSANARRELGFTLIEMMVVIVIMMILMSMVFVAVRRGRRDAQLKAAIAEMKNMERALLRYKEINHGLLPPCLADVTISAQTLPQSMGTRVGRQNQFYYHFRLAFPRSRSTYGSYGVMRNFVLASYTVSSGMGGVVPLDLNTMEPPEALVFWLAGMPTPIYNGQPLYNRKVFGFHSDKNIPLNYDVPTTLASGLPTQHRTFPWEEYGFEFDEARLRDQDGDGWLEYLPPIGATDDLSQMLPPYVYFDSNTYGMMQWNISTMMGTPSAPYLGYPAPYQGWDTAASSGATNVQMLSQWGQALPLASAVDTTNTLSPIQWVNPTGVQIICAGLDGQYSNPNRPTVQAQMSSGSGAKPWIPMYPRGAEYDIADSNQVFLDEQERDNITNFSSSTLADDAQAAGS